LSPQAFNEIGTEVGLLWLKDPYEFVAEVIAAMLDGKTFSPQVMEWYNFYGGPEL